MLYTILIVVAVATVLAQTDVCILPYSDSTPEILCQDWIYTDTIRCGLFERIPECFSTPCLANMKEDGGEACTGFTIESDGAGLIIEYIISSDSPETEDVWIRLDDIPPESREQGSGNVRLAPDTIQIYDEKTPVFTVFSIVLAETVPAGSHSICVVSHKPSSARILSVGMTIRKLKTCPPPRPLPPDTCRLPYEGSPDNIVCRDWTFKETGVDCARSERVIECSVAPCLLYIPEGGEACIAFLTESDGIELIAHYIISSEDPAGENALFLVDGGGGEVRIRPETIQRYDEKVPFVVFTQLIANVVRAGSHSVCVVASNPTTIRISEFWMTIRNLKTCPNVDTESMSISSTASQSRSRSRLRSRSKSRARSKSRSRSRSVSKSKTKSNSNRRSRSASKSISKSKSTSRSRSRSRLRSRSKSRPYSKSNSRSRSVSKSKTKSDSNSQSSSGSQSKSKIESTSQSHSGSKKKSASRSMSLSESRTQNRLYSMSKSRSKSKNSQSKTSSRSNVVKYVNISPYHRGTMMSEVEGPCGPVLALLPLNNSVMFQPLLGVCIESTEEVTVEFWGGGAQDPIVSYSLECDILTSAALRLITGECGGNATVIYMDATYSRVSVVFMTDHPVYVRITNAFFNVTDSVPCVCKKNCLN